jgi:hypothetical protein
VRRFYPAKAHGAVDFATCGLWFAGPEIFRMKWAPASTYPPKVYGAAVLVNTLLTHWGSRKELPYGRLEYGGPGVWSVKTHLVLDAIGSTIVGAAPFVSGSWRKGWNYWAPQLFGVSLVWWSVFTTTLPPKDD